jgi:hypothetical protein
VRARQSGPVRPSAVCSRRCRSRSSVTVKVEPCGALNNRRIGELARAGVGVTEPRRDFTPVVLVDSGAQLPQGQHHLAGHPKETASGPPDCNRWTYRECNVFAVVSSVADCG